MSPKHLSVAGLVIGAAAILAGCSHRHPGRDTPGRDQARRRLAIPQLQLTERAVQRLGIVTRPVGR